MAAHGRSAEFWEQQGNPDKAEHERELAEQDREGAELERQRAEHKPALRRQSTSRATQMAHDQGVAPRGWAPQVPRRRGNQRATAIALQAQAGSRRRRVAPRLAESELLRWAPPRA
jgi:hypothetical protein